MHMNRFEIFGIFIDYIRHRRMWFLLPIMVVVALLAIVSVLIQTNSIFLPFIYAGF